MPLRGNYYFPLVYIVWEFHRRSFAFVSRSGRRFEKFSPLLKGTGMGFLPRRVLIAIPHGIYTVYARI